MRNFIYGLLGAMLGITVYVILLSQMAQPTLAKSNLIEFDNYKAEVMEPPPDNYTDEHPECRFTNPQDPLYDSSYIINDETITCSHDNLVNGDEAGMILDGKGNPLEQTEVNQPAANTYHVKKQDVAKFQQTDIVEFGNEDLMTFELEQPAPVNPEEPTTDENGGTTENPGDGGNSTVSLINFDKLTDFGDVSEESVNVENYSSIKAPEGYAVGRDGESGKLKGVNIKELINDFKYSGTTPVSYGSYIISSKFGMRDNPLNPTEKEFHDGLDISTSNIKGKYAFAVMGGEVIEMSTNETSGKYVIVKHDNFISKYVHLDEFYEDIKVGSKIITGQVIGYIGDTGKTTGAHLHLEFVVNGISVDPEPLLALTGLS